MTFTQLISGTPQKSTSAHGADFSQTIQAIQVISKSFVEYRKTPLDKHLNCSEAYRNILRQNQESLESNLVKTLGYTPLMAKHEMNRSSEILESLIDQLKNDASVRLPVGPCLIYGSWSSPLIRFHQTILCSLFLGNSVLLLAHPLASPLYSMLCEMLISSGLPATQIAVLSTTDSESLETLIQHPSLRATHWRSHFYEIGSLRDPILTSHKKSKIYLGGRNPVIFLHDAPLVNLDKCLQQSLDYHYMAEDRYQRWFVQDKIYDQFVSVVKEKLASPSQPLHGTCFDAEYEKLIELQQGQLRKERGWQDLRHSEAQLALNVSYDFNNCSPWQQQEILGPVLTITRFKNAQEAIKFCNTTSYATHASVYCDKIEKFNEVAQQLTMPRTSWNRIEYSDLDKPTYGLYQSGFGNEISDFEFFRYPKI